MQSRKQKLNVLDKVYKRYFSAAGQLAVCIEEVKRSGKKKFLIDLPEAPVEKTSSLSEAKAWLDVLVNDKLPDIAKQIKEMEET